MARPSCRSLSMPRLISTCPLLPIALSSPWLSASRASCQPSPFPAKPRPAFPAILPGLSLPSSPAYPILSRPSLTGHSCRALAILSRPRPAPPAHPGQGFRASPRLCFPALPLHAGPWLDEPSYPAGPRRNMPCQAATILPLRSFPGAASARLALPANQRRSKARLDLLSCQSIQPAARQALRFLPSDQSLARQGIHSCRSIRSRPGPAKTSFPA